jgi:type 1 glutamine amidotransferase
MGWAAGAAAPKRRILFFTKSSGYEHDAIKRKGDQPGYGERTLNELAEKHGFEITASKDGTVFTPENLAKYDAFFFYTTGDLTQPGTDKNPPMTAEGKAAFLEAIRRGKGFIGTHSATDTFHTQPDPPDRSNRYVNHGDQVDPYVAMIGGEFIKHGKQQKARMMVADARFPGCADLGSGFEMMEEWYSIANFRPDLQVILVQETKGMEGADYQRAPYPATWARMHGRGRVFYTSMGHREDVWTNPTFQAVLLGGMAWACRNVDADVAPNLTKVAPGYAEIPPKGR